MKAKRQRQCFICAKAKRQQQMFYLRESEASATNVLSTRKRSVSDKCFICAKAKRQQQMFYLRESEASAAMFYLCESATTATTKRPVGTEINHTFGDEPLFYQDFYFVCPNSLL
ncbi:hypothetical protein [Lysinibacillus xylanilyticus]|uniref:hypothetical protein n=1 Tax=Lysinibacillus xylanilyticus TaxID=582475 RepID=UPI003D094835